jgi:hypothetical protein
MPDKLVDASLLPAGNQRIFSAVPMARCVVARAISVPSAVSSVTLSSRCPLALPEGSS